MESIELFRTLQMLHQCREELKQGTSFGATLGECDNLVEVRILTEKEKN